MTICESVLLTIVGLTPPMLTAVTPLRLTPMIVALCPPLARPLLGEIPETYGGAAAPIKLKLLMVWVDVPPPVPPVKPIHAPAPPVWLAMGWASVKTVE